VGGLEAKPLAKGVQNGESLIDLYYCQISVGTTLV